jgi:hypothetical protein
MVILKTIAPNFSWAEELELSDFASDLLAGPN